MSTPSVRIYPVSARGIHVRLGFALAGPALALALAAGCATRPAIPTAAPPAAFPPVRIAILSDLHLFDASTSRPGPAFDRNLVRGLKLQAESRAILEAALPRVADEGPDIVLVCGDLTKDGERTSHELAARELAALEKDGARGGGTRVYVIPGNHDILNPDSARYEEDAVVPVESISPVDFPAIYRDLGYGEALRRDPSSLSYLAEPVPGLWLLAIDSCRYRENRASPISSGRVAASTLAWIDGVLADARSCGAVVLPFMHHGLLEHFRGQKRYAPSRLVDGAERLAALLARGGVRVVFTGHGHVQDVAERRIGRQVLFDVGTGSLVTYPNPWRVVQIEGPGRMGILTERVLATADRQDGFPEYSESRLRDGLAALLAGQLERAGARGADAALIAGQAAAGGVQFYRGDEHVGEVRFETAGLNGWGRMLAGFLQGPLTNLGNDLPPADNDLTIDLISVAAE
ncbi:MAG: metallophosphoesterase [Spirochaetes bacterium]|nr:metallophosphoesterase [Spirochaetota bacterium]